VDTIVPHFLRPLDRSLIAQSSRMGYWQDWFFQLYQLKPVFHVRLRRLACAPRRSAAQRRRCETGPAAGFGRRLRSA